MDPSNGFEIFMQAANVLIGGIQLIMDVIGIKTAISNRGKKAIVKSTTKTIKGSKQTQAAFKAFMAAWKKAEGSFTKKALAILQLLKDIDRNLLFDILNSLLKSMSWFDCMKSIAVIIATIAASCVSQGVAIVIKIGLALNSAVDFLADVSKLFQLLS